MSNDSYDELVGKELIAEERRRRAQEERDLADLKKQFIDNLKEINDNEDLRADLYRDIMEGADRDEPELVRLAKKGRAGWEQ